MEFWVRTSYKLKSRSAFNRWVREMRPSHNISIGDVIVNCNGADGSFPAHIELYCPAESVYIQLGIAIPSSSSFTEMSNESYKDIINRIKSKMNNFTWIESVVNDDALVEFDVVVDSTQSTTPNSITTNGGTGNTTMYTYTYDCSSYDHITYYAYNSSSSQYEPVNTSSLTSSTTLTSYI